MKAFGYIERVVKSDFFRSENAFFLHQTCVTCSEQPSHIKTMHSPEKSTVIYAPVPFHWKSIKFEVTEEVLESTLNFSTSLNGKKTNFKCQLQLDN